MQITKDIAHVWHKYHSLSPRYRNVVNVILSIFTLSTLFDSMSWTDEQMSYRSLAGTKKVVPSESVDIDQFNWTKTTKAFLPVLTQKKFKFYVDTFRSTLLCLNSNNIHLIPTGGTLIGTLRHQGMIPWDDDIDVYYFRKDAAKITDEKGPVQKCFRESGIFNHYYGGKQSHGKNIWFHTKQESGVTAAAISAFPIYTEDETPNTLMFVSQDQPQRMRIILKEDVFPLQKMPFHDYDVYIPHNIHKYLELDWSENQLDKFKTPTYDSLMSTAVAGHLHRGCMRSLVKANITDIEYLKHYDPKNYEMSLPFRTKKCKGKIHT